MRSIFTNFLTISANPYEYLAEWKKHNDRKVVACVPMHVPEEMIHSAGLLPVVAWESDELITLGHTHIQPFFCGLVRSLADDALRRRLDVLDGIVLPDTCLAVRGLSGILKRNWPTAYHEDITLPLCVNKPESRSFLRQELERVKSSLQEFTGQEIIAESLRTSINVYNENRALLRKLYSMRRTRPGIIRAKEVVAIVQSSMIMPKEEHSKLLAEFVDELEKVSKGEAARNDKPRVVLSGNLCTAPKADILDLIEEAGTTVIDDDLYVGSRYFARDVVIKQDPVEGLIERYLNMTPPCPTKIDPTSNWADYLVELCKKAQARGVINLIVKYCEPHIFSYPDIRRKLSAAGISEMMLEMEHDVISLKGVKTRLEAFVEIMRGRMRNGISK